MNAPLIIPRGIATAPVRADTCKSCRWMFAEGDGDRTCRRNPPQASVLMVPEQAKAISLQAGVQRLHPQPFSTFPIVTETMWCGAFEGEPGR